MMLYKCNDTIANTSWVMQKMLKNWTWAPCVEHQDRTWGSAIHGDYYVTITVNLHKTLVYPNPIEQCLLRNEHHGQQLAKYNRGQK